MSPNEQLKAFKKATLPADTPVDLLVKLMVVLLNLQALHLVPPFSEQLLEYQASEFGDLMLDACEVDNFLNLPFHLQLKSNNV